MNHNTMTKAEAEHQQQDGYMVRIGKQNQWRLINRAGATLAGEPDLACTDIEGHTLLINIYPGQPKPDHVVDMMISMYAWPLSHTGDLPTPRGRLVYTEGTTEVPITAIDDNFRAFFKTTMQALISDVPPTATPSFEECRFCNIGPRDCAFRVDTDPMAAAVPETPPAFDSQPSLNPEEAAETAEVPAANTAQTC